MIVAVADTHSFIWYLDADRRLSEAAKQAIDRATQAGDEIGISAITLVETVYLVEKGRVPRQTLARMIAEVQSPQSVFVELPLDVEVVQALQHVSRIEVPDMPDRIIAATAPHFQVPAISRDAKIRAAGLQTIW